MVPLLLVVMALEIRALSLIEKDDRHQPN